MVRRQGRQRLSPSVTTESLRQGHGLASWPAPGFKGLRLTAGRRPSNDVWLMVGWHAMGLVCKAVTPGQLIIPHHLNTCVFTIIYIDIIVNIYNYIYIGLSPWDWVSSK